MKNGEGKAKCALRGVGRCGDLWWWDLREYRKQVQRGKVNTSRGTQKSDKGSHKK